MGQPKAGIAAAAPAMRAATPADLPAINRVIALARDSWDLPERVRRLAGRLAGAIGLDWNIEATHDENHPLAALVGAPSEKTDGGVESNET